MHFINRIFCIEKLKLILYLFKKTVYIYKSILKQNTFRLYIYQLTKENV